MLSYPLILGVGFFMPILSNQDRSVYMLFHLKDLNYELMDRTLFQIDELSIQKMIELALLDTTVLVKQLY